MATVGIVAEIREQLSKVTPQQSLCKFKKLKKAFSPFSIVSSRI